MNKVKYPAEKKCRNALERLNNLNEDAQIFIWDSLLDQPVADIVEQLLEKLKPSDLDGLVDDFLKAEKDQ